MPFLLPFIILPFHLLSISFLDCSEDVCGGLCQSDGQCLCYTNTTYSYLSSSRCECDEGFYGHLCQQGICER